MYLSLQINVKYIFTYQWNNEKMDELLPNVISYSFIFSVNTCNIILLNYWKPVLFKYQVLFHFREIKRNSGWITNSYYANYAYTTCRLSVYVSSAPLQARVHVLIAPLQARVHVLRAPLQAPCSCFECASSGPVCMSWERLFRPRVHVLSAPLQDPCSCLECAFPGPVFISWVRLSRPNVHVLSAPLQAPCARSTVPGCTVTERMEEIHSSAQNCADPWLASR